MTDGRHLEKLKKVMSAMIDQSTRNLARWRILTLRTVIFAFQLLFVRSSMTEN